MKVVAGSAAKIATRSDLEALPDQVVGEIIEVAAESVEASRSFSMGFSEKPPRPVEAAAFRGERHIGSGESFGRFDCWLHFIIAAGMSASTTFAEHSTPGTPAPG